MKQSFRPSRARTAALAAVGAFLALCGGPLHEAGAAAPPPPTISDVETSASALASSMQDLQDAWRTVHDGRRFADGLTDGWADPDVHAATRLARRFARARSRAARTTTRAHRRIARELGRWGGDDAGGFYSPRALAGLTRAIWHSEQAAAAASEARGFLTGLAPGGSLDAFAAADDDASARILAAGTVCDTAIVDLLVSCADLTGSIRREAHLDVMESRLRAALDLLARGQAADSGRVRAASLTRAYRVLVGSYRRAGRFLAQEQRVLRLVAADDDGSITNGTGKPIVVREILATLTVTVDETSQTSHALGSEYAPGSLPLLLPAGESLDGFDHLVFDRDALAQQTPGVVTLTYETSLGDVHATHVIP